MHFQKSGTFSEDYYYVIDPETGQESMEHEETITYWPAPSKRKKPEWFTPFTGIMLAYTDYSKKHIKPWMWMQWCSPPPA
jgi:hypothetical protein